MADCLTCEEIELRICELDEQLTSGACGGMLIKEGDTTFDYSKDVDSKMQLLRVYRDLHKMKCGPGAGELYEFVHVPCVKPYTCRGTACATVPPRNRVDRRYRR